MEYKHLRQDEKDVDIATAILEREREHHNYEINRLNYISMIQRLDKELPAEWPTDLIPFRDVQGEKLAEAPLTEEQYELCFKLQRRDRYRLLLRTNTKEQHNAECVHTALVEQLPDATEAMKVVRTKEEARIAARLQP